MRLLLDANVFLRAQDRPGRLGHALEVLADPTSDRLVSVATRWEISIKVPIGELRLTDHPSRYIPSRMRATVAKDLPVERSHTLAVADLAPLHRDAVDRLRIAQAQSLDLTIVTGDTTLRQYDVNVLLV